jgi:CNT family concentrative nucleoside transporter
MTIAESIIRGIIGMGFLISLCYLLSNNRKAIDWSLVRSGLFIQLVFALLVLKVPAVHSFFEGLSGLFVKVIEAQKAGARFLLGPNLMDPTGGWGFVFAFQILPTIIFFSALSSILYYLGVLQKVTYFFAWIMSKTMKISGAESLSNAANIFLGQTEAPLMVKPYIKGMTKSEILCIMIGGMANTAGSVLAAYVGFLGGNDPATQKFYALHLMTQSIMSAPAAIVAAKILFPETQEVAKDLNIHKEEIGSNFLDAIANGTSDGLKLAVNVAAMLLVFTALIAVLNKTLFWMGGLSFAGFVPLNDMIAIWTNNMYKGFSLEPIFGFLFAPFAWLIGVPTHDIFAVGQLLGEKTIINEFQAYGTLARMQAEGTILAQSKSMVIATYALCGFANFASIGIQIGGISILAPNQRQTLSELGIKSLIGGTIACLMVACIAGMIVV